MAYNKAVLKAGIQDLMDNLPTYPGEDYPDATTVANDVAQKWADAYATYAADARSCQARPPTGITTAKATLKTALAASFVAGGPASSTASDMATAFTAFWLTPPITFLGGATPGAVTAVGGTAALQAGLLTAWAANLASNASNSDAAQSMADLLDTFSKTVVAAHAAPSACTAPLV